MVRINTLTSASGRERASHSVSGVRKQPPGLIDVATAALRDLSGEWPRYCHLYSGIIAGHLLLRRVGNLRWLSIDTRDCAVVFASSVESIRWTDYLVTVCLILAPLQASSGCSKRVVDKHWPLKAIIFTGVVHEEPLLTSQ